VTLLVKVITDMSEFQRFEEEFNCFVSKWSENPFFSSVFVKIGAQLSIFRGWNPLLLIIYDGNKIVGIAPLAFRKNLGFCFVKFLYGPNFLMDFVINENYREICVSEILYVLTRFFNCNFLNLSLSEESCTLVHLDKACNSSNLYFHTGKCCFGDHRIVPVNSTWDEFVKTKNGKFRRGMKRVKKRIEAIGNWKVTCVERFEDDQEVCEKIIRIYGLSWKNKWMTERNIAYDPELAAALYVLRDTQKNKPFFSWKVYFLEINGNPIAYTLLFQHKGTVFVKRTSYDNAYKNSSPGIFLLNYVIRDIFNEGKVHTIDWGSDHRYQKLWAPSSLSRTDVNIRSGFFLPTLERFLAFPFVKSVVYPLYCLKALLLKHKANPSIKEFYADQHKLNLTPCGKNLTTL
jgi:hypothetical protein